MANSFNLSANIRDDLGKGASRRLRREAKIPAVIYGGGTEPQSIAISQPAILKCLNEDSFYSQIIDIEINGEIQETILRDLQRHPFKPLILHADFQRVVRGQELTVSVPIHYINVETSAGVKAGGILSQNIIDVEVVCRPSKIPEALEIDVMELGINESLHLSDISMPEDVRIVAFENGVTEDNNAVTVSIHPPKVEASVSSDESVETTEDSE